MILNLHTHLGNEIQKNISPVSWTKLVMAASLLGVISACGGKASSTPTTENSQNPQISHYNPFATIDGQDIIISQLDPNPRIYADSPADCPEWFIAYAIDYDGWPQDGDPSYGCTDPN